MVRGRTTMSSGWRANSPRASISRTSETSRWEPDGCFYEAEHLDGRVDMVSLVDVLLREERAAREEGRRADIPMRPDHGHLLADDIAKGADPGYSYIGRLKGLAELRGVMRALDARRSA
jgi:mannonate dehydratase